MIAPQIATSQPMGPHQLAAMPTVTRRRAWVRVARSARTSATASSASMSPICCNAKRASPRWGVVSDSAEAVCVRSNRSRCSPRASRRSTTWRALLSCSRSRFCSAGNSSMVCSGCSSASVVPLRVCARAEMAYTRGDSRPQASLRCRLASGRTSVRSWSDAMRSTALRMGTTALGPTRCT